MWNQQERIDPAHLAQALVQLVGSMASAPSDDNWNQSQRSGGDGGYPMMTSGGSLPWSPTTRDTYQYSAVREPTAIRSSSAAAPYSRETTKGASRRSGGSVRLRTGGRQELSLVEHKAALAALWTNYEGFDFDTVPKKYLFCRDCNMR